MQHRITIGGCRDYGNYPEFKKFVDHCLSKLDGEIIIISGHCSGVDTMAERYARECGHKLEIYPADWEKYGKAAGPIRNKFMVENSDYVIAFWDNNSKGTKSLINYAKKFNKPLRIKEI